MTTLLFARFGRVVSLQILDDKRGRRIGDGGAECLAHLGDFDFPGGRGQRGLHGDVVSAVAEATEASGFGATFSIHQLNRILRIGGDLVDRILGECCGSGLLELADRDRQPPRSGDEPGDGASAADARAQAGAQDADAGGVQGAARAESTLA